VLRFEGVEHAGVDPLVAPSAEGRIGHLVIEDRFDVDPGGAGHHPDGQSLEAQSVRDAMAGAAHRRGLIHRSKIASMLPAVFGLIGVIVGGLLNAAVTAWQARRADVASGRVAARLVDLELREAAAILVLNQGANRLSQGDSPFSNAAWRKYRDVLARALSDGGWEAVATAYEVIEGSPERVLANFDKASPNIRGSPNRREIDIVLGASRSLSALARRTPPSFDSASLRSGEISRPDQEG
jgi:hypothetical protein